MTNTYRIIEFIMFFCFIGGVFGLISFWRAIGNPANPYHAKFKKFPTWARLLKYITPIVIIFLSFQAVVMLLLLLFG